MHTVKLYIHHPPIISATASTYSRHTVPIPLKRFNARGVSGQIPSCGGMTSIFEKIGMNDNNDTGLPITDSHVIVWN